MFKKLVAVLIVGWGVAAVAAVFNHGSASAVRTGVLASAQSSTGAGANDVICDGASSLDVATTISGTATVIIEGSINGGVTRFTVSGSSHTSSTRLSITNPLGPYRTNVSVCTGCSVTATYACVWRVNKAS